MRSLRSAPKRGAAQAPQLPPTCSRYCQKAFRRSPQSINPMPGTSIQAFPVGSSDDPELRERVKQLKRMFYKGSGEGSSETRSGSVVTVVKEEPRPAPAHLLRDLPLWREEQPILPFSQRVLHVQTPGLVHMFETIFSRGTPWRFGCVFQPPADASNGRQATLRAGSRAPVVGVLAEVTRAVRLADGGLFVLITATRRFQVRRCLADAPFLRADVAILPDAEHLQQHHDDALHCACDAAAGSDDEDDGDGGGAGWSREEEDLVDPRRLRSDSHFPPCGSEDVGIEDIMMAAAEGAAAAAAAEALAWEEYEFAVSRRQQWDDMPREGADSTETHFLMTWVMEEGVRKVVPLPDGEVVGRWDLEGLSVTAAAAAQQQLRAAVLEELHDPGSTGAANALSVREREPTYRGEEGVPLPTREELGLNGEPEHDMALLEKLLWERLDLVAGLTLKLRQQRYTLPLGLLQLRPLPPLLHAPGAASAPEHPHHLAASDGLDTFADRAWPLMRRVEKLSWTVPSVFMEMGSEKQQAVLECTSVVARLWVALTLILEASSELTVEAAVQGLGEDHSS